MNLSSTQSGRIIPNAEPHALPLPGGEGWGEGERDQRISRIMVCPTHFAVVLLFLLTTSAFSANTSPLADAAEKSDLSGIRTLLKKQADVDATQPDGMTALHWAVYQGDMEAAKLLVQHKANVTATNRYGVPPLSLACQKGNGPMVELLLEQGADPNTTQPGG